MTATGACPRGCGSGASPSSSPPGPAGGDPAGGDPAAGGPAGYILTVSDPAQAAPGVTRALVAAGADVLSITESRHTLEDVDPVVAAAVWHSPCLLAQVFFIPLLAGWAIWICLAISSKASDIRVAQQLGALASLPPIALTLLLSFQVINSTLILAASLVGALLVIDCAAYLLVSKLFDRERLVTGTKSATA
jgi:hypothetical protein